MYEKQLSSETVYEGKIITLCKDKVMLDDGRTSTREVAHHANAACILALNGENAVLVEQYRYAVGDILLELPAGKLDAGEEPMQCALRELAEETGYTAHSCRLLGSVLASPGFCTEKIFLYFTDDVSTGQPKPDDGEIVRVREIPVRQLIGMAQSGELEDAKTVCAVLLAQKLMPDLV